MFIYGRTSAANRWLIAGGGQTEGRPRRNSAAAGRRIEGRKSHAVSNPEAVAMAKRLRRASPKTGERQSLREIASMLPEAGHLNERGRPFNPNSIKAMLEGS